MFSYRTSISMSGGKIYPCLALIIVYFLMPSGAVTWNPDIPTQRVNVVEGHSAVFAWNITFDNANTGIIRLDISRVIDPVNDIQESIIYRLTSNVNATVPESSYKSRGKDLQISYHTPSNTARVVFTLHNVDYTVDNEKQFQMRVTFSPSFVTEVRNADLKVQVISVQSSCVIHPNATTVNETESVSLNVITTGNPPVHEYIWTHPYGSRLTANNTLTFTASRQDAGIYNVSVYNGVGNRSYCTSNVNVQYAPESTTIKIFPNKTKFCLGDQIQVNCFSTRANPISIKYSLYQNDKLINNNMSRYSPRVNTYRRIARSVKVTFRVIFRINIVVSRYFLVNLNISGNISFLCVPSNEAGVGEKNSVSLEVEGFPAILDCTKLIDDSHLTYGAVSEGNDVKLKCNISDSKPLDVSWRYGSRLWHQEVLEFPSINRKDAGTYEIRVKSGGSCNQTAKRNVTLEVYYLPDITCSNKTLTVQEKDNVQLVCNADGNPRPDMMWMRNGNLQRMGSTLLIEGVTKNHAGIYTFVANNSIGHKIEEILIAVNYTTDCSPVIYRNKGENKITMAAFGVLFALSFLLNLIFIAAFFWQRRKESTGSSGERPNKSQDRDDKGHMNNIPLQETSLSATDNKTPNMPESLGRQEIPSDIVGIPEYEAMMTRTQPSQPQSGVQTNNPMPQYESVDQHRLPRPDLDPSSLYQTVQPRTGDYESLSPSTRLPRKGTVLASTGSPTRTEEYQTVHHQGVSPQYQSLDDLSRC